MTLNQRQKKASSMSKVCKYLDFYEKKRVSLKHFDGILQFISTLSLSVLVS